MCSLPHVKELAENHFTELKLREVYCGEILSKLKNTLKVILWTPRYVEILSRWLLFINVAENGQIKEKSLENVEDNIIKLMKFERLTSFYLPQSFYLENLYRATFLVHMTDPKTYLVRVDEREVYISFYTDPVLSELLGVEMSIAIDIGLALGSTESIVESLYSVMNSQSIPGGQDNNTLALRTKIDWLIPEVQQANRIVTGAANLYLDGDKSQHLPKHRLPILGAKATYGSGKDFGKVLARKTAEAVRLSFLL